MKPSMGLAQETPEATPDAVSQRWGVASLSFSMLLASLGTSIANVGLPALADAFDATFREVQWVVIAYLLAITVLVVGVGRLGDMVGRRRLLLAGIIVFALASLLCGMAPTLWLLVAARMIQGAGAAVMMVLSVALVNETVPRAKIGSAMGLLGTTSAIGTALGPTLGGMLVESAGWRAIFYVMLPFGIGALALASGALPADRRVPDAGGTRFDVWGMLLLAVALAAYALAMTIGRVGFGSLNVALLLGAAICTGLFALVESQVVAPLLSMALIRERALAAALAAGALVSAVMMATLVVGPFYLSRGQSLGAAEVGMVMSVGPVISAATGILAGRAVDRLGHSEATVAGLVAMLTGAAAMSVLPATFGVAGYIAAIAILTPGYQLFQAANNTGVMAGVGPQRRGVVSGVLSLSRNLGLVTGASVMGAVFALAAGDVAAASPDAVATGMRITFAVATAMIAVALGATVAGRSVGPAAGEE